MNLPIDPNRSNRDPTAAPVADPSGLDMDALIAAAKTGCEKSLSRLLAQCRDYLLHVANQDMHSNVAAKLGASDVVQETMMEAHAGITTFSGTTEAELRGWLRAILKHNLTDMIRGYVQTEKRNVDREQRLGSGLHAKVHSDETPSRLVGKREQQDAVSEAMNRLPDDQRVAIELRNFELLSFAEIGQRLDRSEEAARKLWARALHRLQTELNHDNA